MLKYLLTAVLLAGSAFITLRAQAGDNDWVGSYRWNAKASHYKSGAYATEQTMEITRVDANSIAVSQTVTLADGKTFSWNIDSPLDDTLRHASTWMSFAFKRVSGGAIHNRYKMDDGQEGEETFTASPTQIVIKGHSFKDGKKQPYVEVWDRVETKK